MRRFRDTIIGAYIWNFFSCCHGTAFSHSHPIWFPTRTWATVINRKAPSEPRCRASATWLAGSDPGPAKWWKLIHCVPCHYSCNDISCFARCSPHGETISLAARRWKRRNRCKPCTAWNDTYFLLCQTYLAEQWSFEHVCFISLLLIRQIPPDFVQYTTCELTRPCEAADAILCVAQIESLRINKYEQIWKWQSFILFPETILLYH